MALWAFSRRIKLPKRAQLATNLLAVAAIAQVSMKTIFEKYAKFGNSQGKIDSQRKI